mgnify:CR=1 FL=1
MIRFICVLSDIVSFIFVTGSLTNTVIADIRRFGDRLALGLPIFRTEIAAFRNLKLYIIATLAHFNAAFFITEKAQGAIFEKCTPERLFRIIFPRLKSTIFFHFLSNGTWVFVQFSGNSSKRKPIV